MNNPPNKRLLSLDILRGITIAGMIMVNNPGSWGYIYAPLGHAEWIGLTPTDLVFPFFMFIMGISTYMSLRKFDFRLSGAVAWKIIRRTIVIFAIGLAIAWFGLTMRTYHQLGEESLSFFERLGRSMWNFDHIRILGVMPRLAICYGVAAFIALIVKHKYIPHIVSVTLIAYFVILITGKGFEFSEDNIISVVDRAILGSNHMYHDNGWLSTPRGCSVRYRRYATYSSAYFAGTHHAAQKITPYACRIFSLQERYSLLPDYFSNTVVLSAKKYGLLHLFSPHAD